MSASQDTPLALQIREAQISEPEADMLLSAFAPFFNEAEQWRQRAASITVTSVEDKPQMMEARKVRLALKDIRVGVEHSRKKLKEESLRKGKAIDGMANVIKFLIVPIEEELEQKENFAKVLEEEERQALKQKREQELLALQADPSLYNLAELPEESYLKVLEAAQAAVALKIEAAERAESERLAKERADAEERERMRVENERLKAEAEAKNREIEMERAAKQKAEAELQARRAEEARIERERADQEKQARLAPDREKLAQLADSIVRTPMPDVSSDEAKAVIKRAIEMLSQASQYVKTQAVGL